MAEVMLREIISQKQGDDWVVDSAGTDAQTGGKAARIAVEIMQEEGIDLSNFRSKLIDQQLAKESNIILTMTLRQKEDVIDSFPVAKGRTYTLKEFAGDCEDVEIADPYGFDRETYRWCAREIKDNLSKIASKLED